MWFCLPPPTSCHLRGKPFFPLSGYWLFFLYELAPDIKLWLFCCLCVSCTIIDLERQCNVEMVRWALVTWTGRVGMKREWGGVKKVLDVKIWEEKFLYKKEIQKIKKEVRLNARPGILRAILGEKTQSNGLGLWSWNVAIQRRQWIEILLEVWGNPGKAGYNFDKISFNCTYWEIWENRVNWQPSS